MKNAAIRPVKSDWYKKKDCRKLIYLVTELINVVREFRNQIVISKFKQVTHLFYRIFLVSP